MRAGFGAEPSDKVGSSCQLIPRSAYPKKISEATPETDFTRFSHIAGSAGSGVLVVETAQFWP